MVDKVFSNKVVLGKAVPGKVVLEKAILDKVVPGKVVSKITIASKKGPIEVKYYKVAGATSAVITVGGCGGGWHNPCGGYLYPKSCTKLNTIGFSALHLAFRNGGELTECTYDVLQGLEFLKKEGITKAGLVGWSFGGAVVCRAAAKSEAGIMKALVTLATQSFGADPIAQTKDVACLFIHGTEDTCLPVRCSEYTFNLANEPKKLKIVKDHHGFFDVHKEIEDEIMEWFTTYLK